MKYSDADIIIINNKSSNITIDNFKIVNLFKELDVLLRKNNKNNNQFIIISSN